MKNSKKVTDKNYYSQEMNKMYTGSTQIKSFLKCESETLAELNGEWAEPKSEAMTVSSYVDAWMSGDLEQFKENNPEIFTKSKELKAQYKIADKVIEQIKEDSMFLKYINGEHQVIMTGEISGVPVKIRIDSYFPDKAIVDLKTMRTLDLSWNEETHQKENFIDMYDYVLQAALYQEIVRQNTGKQLPFIIAVATKEEYSERALLSIPQDIMDAKLEFLKEYLPHLQALKDGKMQPISCKKCNYCKSKYRTTKIYEYSYFFQNRNML